MVNFGSLCIAWIARNNWLSLELKSIMNGEKIKGKSEMVYYRIEMADSLIIYVMKF